jgi:hypothetical protein
MGTDVSPAGEDTFSGIDVVEGVLGIEVVSTVCATA